LACPVPNTGSRRWTANAPAASPSRLIAGLVLAAALLVAGWIYGQFLACHRSLWDSGAHDRNSHYLNSLRLVVAVRQGRPLEVLHEVERARVWPPLHAVLAAGVLAVAGLDYRLAVLPSLAGWVGSVLFAFLLARRAVPRGGDAAGSAAALFVLVSPAHRAFATDVMLESLGACLTLLVLWSYARAREGGGTSPWPGRLLGLALMALFLEKYNYWLLAAAALLLTELLTRPIAYSRAALAALASAGGPRAQLRHPLTWVLAILLALIGVACVRAESFLVVAGYRLTLFPPDNLTHAAYAVIFLRLAAAWRSGRGAWARGWDPRWRQVATWHLWPAACWLLLPKHPSAFLWYLSPANASASQHSDLLAGIGEYARWAVEDYHAAPWGALLAAALVAVAMVSWLRLRPGGRVALCLTVLAAVLCVIHPNRMARNLHPWLACGWVAGGAGLATLLHPRPRSTIDADGPPGLSATRALVAGPILAALALAASPHLFSTPHSLQGGTHPREPCFLDLTDSYLDDLAANERTTILAAVPVQPLAQWTYLQRFGRLDRLEDHRFGFGLPGAANREAFRCWLATTSCDTIVYFDRVPGFPTLEGGLWELHGELRDILLNQCKFRLVREQTFPRHGCRILIWERAGGERHGVGPPER
jgi:hypothetical protein